MLEPGSKLEDHGASMSANLSHKRITNGVFFGDFFSAGTDFDPKGFSPVKLQVSASVPEA